LWAIDCPLLSKHDAVLAAVKAWPGGSGAGARSGDGHP